MEYNITEPESNFTAWIGNSIILMSASIILFHITKSKTLPMHKYAAAVVCIGLIFIDITFSLMAIVPYNTRIADLNKTTKNSDDKKSKMERIYTYIYSAIISLFILLQIVICYYIVKESLHPTQACANMFPDA